MTYPPIVWILFSLFILVMLGLDLLVFRRKAHAVSMKEALGWSAVWIGLAVVFCVGLLVLRGQKPALEFLTGYLIEESLSVDNLFVILLIFSFFHIDAEHQHRVLFWGILGALVMRLGFILAGIRLIETFHWAIYVFGAVLVVSGLRMWSHRTPSIQPDKNPVLRLVRRFVPVTPGFEGSKFFVRREGRRLATPLFVVLVLVESADLVFALDSIPAVLAITRDPFIVFSSNAFAILGLRALYFALAGVMKLFHYLHYGLSAILVFVGTKMLLADLVHIPVAAALGVVAIILGGSVWLSLARPRPADAETLAAELAGGGASERQPPA
jgi:tellurite resistance protein TerC